MPEYHLARPEALREQVVRRSRAAGAPRLVDADDILIAIRLGKDDVKGNRGGPEIAQSRDEPRDMVAPPRPLADRRQAPFVDVDDDERGSGGAGGDQRSRVS